MKDRDLGCKLPTIEQLRYGLEMPSKNGVSLGIVTKTPSPLILRGLQSCENDLLPAPELHSAPAKESTDFRARRYALKSVVNTLFPDSRTSKCMRFRAPNHEGVLSNVDILKGERIGKAFYQGLMTCGSVWNCPVCSAKISERRRLELKEAIAQAELLELNVHLVTLTVPHGVTDDINDLLNGLRGCTRRLSEGKLSIKNQLRRIAPEVEIEGYIRTLEVTHGKNGFHPHFHLLVFTSYNCGGSLLQYAYEKAWKRACKLSGLPEPNQHGCTVRDGSYASEYVSKWGLEDEMTKANSKVTSQKGKTPFGFLHAVLDGFDLDYSPDRAKSLFRVYSRAFKGRRQLYWSNGLRKKLCLAKELTDHEIASVPDDDRSVLLASLSIEQWRSVLKFKQEANLLSIAELNPEAIGPFIKNLSEGG